jgi:hypothetical protein
MENPTTVIKKFNAKYFYHLSFFKFLEENKLKMFRWKLFNFNIPNKVLLFKWKIVENSLCNFCKLDEVTGIIKMLEDLIDNKLCLMDVFFNICCQYS